ncbi:MAG: hypothetical protein CVU89_05570 [Firmicutes bacterium HGW-Firmicutes-14]|nr:MAG: hypothetical protein CVU89_05570 [Firmicutes bacterium HGW-Firmicutes-14]
MAKNGFITIKADSMKEALEKARMQLNTSKENIEVKVVAKEKHGFIFQKETIIIKARRKEPALEQLVEDVLSGPKVYSENIESVADGSVEITEGKIVVKNPQYGGKYPSIEPGENTAVIINGEPVSEATIISAEDDVKVKAFNQEPYIEFAVEITDDKMNAFLVAKRRFGREFRVKDCPSCLNARVRTETVKDVPPRKISPREVIQLLKDKGIIYGINESAMSRVVENNTEGTVKVLIAAGQPPEPSKDAVIEYVFEKKEASSAETPNAYRKIAIKSVEVGEVLAVKSSPQEGEAGTNLFGESIVPKPPEDTKIIIGEGVKLVKNETVAVAAITGRPVLEGRKIKILKVLPIYTVDGDVDISVGNINFKGDVLVYGNVLEGFRLWAGGDITVLGNVIQAKLNAGGNIIIHNNALSSELNAGGTVLIYKRLIPDLKHISSLTHNLLKAMQLLKTNRSFKINTPQQGEGQLIQLLIDNKFNMIPKLIKEVFEIINNSESALIPEVIEAMNQLQKLTGLNPLRIQKGQEVFDIIRTLEVIVGKLQENCELNEPSNVTANYIQNSAVKASGDIIITGQGVITSELLAGGDINVNGQRAVVRGGKLSAGGTIRVNELGSNADVICIVKLSEGSVLEAQLVHPAVTIESGSGKYQFNDLSRCVRAYISPQKKLEIEKLKAK